MRQAERLLREEGLLSLPVDIGRLAETRQILIRPMEERKRGVSGMLVRHGNSFGILYDASIPNCGYQRFSIGHELGHFFIDGHLDHVTSAGDVHESRAGFVSDDSYEREADFFASGLLMPATLTRAVIRRQPDGLAAVEAIHREAVASLTAAAIRYVDLSDIPMAVVVSRGGRVDYCFLSDSLRSLKDITWPRKGTAVPGDTLTDAMAGRIRREASGFRESAEIDLRDWLGGSRTIPALEEVVTLGGYRRVLTIVTCLELVDDDYDLEDRSDWSSRF